MVGLFIERPLEFSAFPTVLLISTMLRLSLNLASTRLILSHGHDRHRRRRPCHPGLRRLRHGRQFRHRRHRVRDPRRRQFRRHHQGLRPHRRSRGAVQLGRDARQADGDRRRSQRRPHRREARPARAAKTSKTKATSSAPWTAPSKFVRGDAVAGLIITVINVIAGIFIGVAQKGLSFNEATQTLHLADRRRRPRLADPGADRFDRCRHAGLQSGRQRLDRQSALRPAWRASRRRLASPRSSLLSGAASRHSLRPLPRAGRSRPAAPPGSSHDKKDKAKVAKAESRESRRRAGQGRADHDRAADRPDPPGAGLWAAGAHQQRTRHAPHRSDQGAAPQLANEMGFIMPAVRIQDNLQLAANSYVLRVKEIEVGPRRASPQHAAGHGPARRADHAQRREHAPSRRSVCRRHGYRKACARKLNSAATPSSNLKRSSRRI